MGSISAICHGKQLALSFRMLDYLVNFIRRIVSTIIALLRPPDPAEIQRWIDAVREMYKTTDAAQDLANSAIKAANRCDAAAAAHLIADAERLAKKAEAFLAEIPLVIRGILRSDDHLEASINHVRDLQSYARLNLRACRHREGKAKEPVYRKCGSFSKTTYQNPTVGAPSLNFVFELDKECTCKAPCLLSVWHLFDTKTGALKTEPFDKEKGGFSGDYNPPTGLPHGGKHVGGYGVDTPRCRMVDDKFCKNECPCMIGSKYDPVKRQLTGVDAPNAMKVGVSELFETVVICLKEDGSFEILGSMRWSAVRSSDEIKLDVLKTPPGKDGKTDWGDISPPAKKAIANWIILYGGDCAKQMSDPKHKVKAPKGCCPGAE